MASFQIISDSSCDFDPTLAKDKNVELIPFYITFDNSTYLKENVDISKDEFYHRLVNDELFPKTSLPSVQDYINVYKPYLEKGEDILSLCISSLLSGSYQSARNAANILLEEFPDRKISIIDSKQATFGQGIILFELIKMRDDGLTLEESTKIINNIKDSATVIFTVDSLDHLQKGGRIGKATAIAGSLLNIKPILLLKDGEISSLSKARGSKKALSFVINTCIDRIGENRDNYDYIVGHTSVPEEASYLKKTFIEDYGFKVDYPLINAGVTVGTHVGPGGIGIGFIKKYNT